MGQDFVADPSFNADAPIFQEPDNSEIKEYVDSQQSKEVEPAAPEITSAPTKEDIAEILKREFEYPAVGKTIKEPLEMILKRASQGYDYANKMGDINKLNKEVADYQARLKNYEHLNEIDEYCRQNPEWTNYLKEQWEKKGAVKSGIDPNDPMYNFFDSRLKQFSETFDKLNQEISSLKSEREQAQIKKEDQELAGEIQDIRKQYSNLPWSNIDEFGRDLEAKVIEHAAQNGIKSFKTAFRDLYHDDIVKHERDRMKEDLAKERSEQRKKGFITDQVTSKNPAANKKPLGQQSYDDIARQAKQELGLI